MAEIEIGPPQLPGGNQFVDHKKSQEIYQAIEAMKVEIQILKDAISEIKAEIGLE